MIGPKLTWDELANFYDKAHDSNSNRPARTLKMGTVFDWAAKQTDKFFIDSEDYIHQILPDGELNADKDRESEIYNARHGI